MQRGMDEIKRRAGRERRKKKVSTLRRQKMHKNKVEN